MDIPSQKIRCPSLIAHRRCSTLTFWLNAVRTHVFNCLHSLQVRGPSAWLLRYAICFTKKRHAMVQCWEIDELCRLFLVKWHSQWPVRWVLLVQEVWHRLIPPDWRTWRTSRLGRAKSGAGKAYWGACNTCDWGKGKCSNVYHLFDSVANRTKIPIAFIRRNPIQYDTPEELSVRTSHPHLSNKEY